MLQINSGKLFTRAVERENHLHGVVYTNANLAGEDVVETVIGKIYRGSSHSSQPQAVIYEFIERIESSASGPNVIVSHTVDPYLSDLAIIFGFFLNCVCSPDIETTRRLTNGQLGISTKESPGKFVKRIFDNTIWCTPEEVNNFIHFAEQLLGLERKTYLGVMRAIRSYTNGVHRIADDLELAYTLLVASVESLAQDFDGHQPDWDSYTENKKVPIDAALASVPQEVAEQVRSTLLKFEHIALARRFKEFAIAHVNASYFREPTGIDEQAIGRMDLPEVLAAAYSIRSKHIHQLEKLPDAIRLAYNYPESVLNGSGRLLTLQGLTRLMRHVILEFVRSQPVVEKQEYNYVMELAGVAQVTMHSHYWIGNCEGNINEFGLKKLEGFLEQIVEILTYASKELTDLRPLLKKIEETGANFKSEHRRPYWALYVVYNRFANSSAAPMSKQIETTIQKELSVPSVESLFVFLLYEQVIEWPLDQHSSILNKYFQLRGKKSGFRSPRLLEAAIILELAERYRIASDFENCQKLIVMAVENYPGKMELQRLEQDFNRDVQINWKGILIPQATELKNINL